MMYGNHMATERDEHEEHMCHDCRQTITQSRWHRVKYGNNKVAYRLCNYCYEVALDKLLTAMEQG